MNNEQRTGDKMKSNNPFKVHNIEHLSASKINSWINYPAMFIATTLCGVKSKVGAGAFRGTSVEYALEKKLSNKDYNHNIIDEFLYSKFDSECLENNISIYSERASKERKGLSSYYYQAISLYNDFGEPQHYQHKIYYSLHDDLPIPFLGFIDFVFEDSIRDTKTTARMPSAPSQGHQRQLAIYSKAFPEKELWLDYITPKKSVSYKVNNVEQRINEVIKVAFGLQKFLSISSDPFELASMVYPNYDDWMWSEDMKQQAKQIWSNE